MLEATKKNLLLVSTFFSFLICWWAVIFFGLNSEHRLANQFWSTSYQIIAIIGVFAGYVIIKRKSFEKENLYNVSKFLTLGLALQVLGQTVYAFYNLVLKRDTPYPSFGDVGYFGSVIFYLVASIFLAKEFYFQKKYWFILTAVPTAILLMLLNIYAGIRYNFVFSLGVHPLFDIGYATLQSLTVALAVGATTVLSCLGKNYHKKPIYLFLCALSLQLIADAYFINSARSGTWLNGGFGDVLYLISYFVMTSSFLLQLEETMTVEILAVTLNSFLFIQFVLSDSKDASASSATILFVGLAASYFLVKRNSKEVTRKEQQLRLSALEESNRKLKELDQQKTEFLNIAAHQLRTPASIINNYIAMLADGDYGAVSDEVKKVHQNIGESNQWLVRLADEFLNIAHLESGQVKYTKRPGDLRAIVAAVVKELLPKAEHKGLALTVDTPAPLPAVFDEEKMRHVILNFIDNAIKYTPGGSVAVAAAPADGGIKVTVTDTGIGFTPEESTIFFQKFQRGKNAHQIEVNTSTGLGLYIARKFAEGHGGRVFAKSAGLGKGSEFGFWIPEHAQ